MLVTKFTTELLSTFLPLCKRKVLVFQCHEILSRQFLAEENFGFPLQLNLLISETIKAFRTDTHRNELSEPPVFDFAVQNVE